MSKMLEFIKELSKDGKEVSVLLPGIGSALARVESVDDDLVILTRAGKPKVVIHYAQLVIQSS